MTILDILRVELQLPQFINAEYQLFNNYYVLFQI